jgi:hypothetical protein
MCLPCAPFTQTVVANTALSAVTPISPSTVVGPAGAQLITNWPNFTKVFEEYCLTGFRFEVRYQTASFGTGLVLITLDEKDSTAPTILQYYKPHIEVLTTINSGVDCQIIEWMPSDLADLQWSSTTAAFTPVWMKFFSAINSSSSGTITVTGTFTVNFRGLTAD